MAHKNKRIDAKRLYLEEGLDVAAISKRIDIPEATVYRWKLSDAKEGSDWDKEREEIKLTSFSAGKKALQAFNKRLEKILSDVDSTEGRFQKGDMYELRQLQLIISNFISKEDNYGSVLLMISKLIDFLSERDPDTLSALRPLLIEFGSAMSKEYGKKR